MLIFLAFAQATFAQGSFQNLDFEAAVRTPVSPGFISAADALPYWTVRLDDTASTFVWDSPGLDATMVVLISGNTLNYPPIQGSYSVEIGANSFDPAYTTASISQTGLIPEGTSSIQLLARNFYVSGSVSSLFATLNGSPVALIPVSTSGGVTTVVGDISAFAGSSAELAFKVSNSAFVLDSISFSSQAVPEPSALSLIGLGLFGLGWHWRRSIRA